MPEQFDVVVVGSGTGGYVAAVRSAQLPRSTAVLERDDVIGGRRLNDVCMPAKAVLRSADIHSEVREAGEFGISFGLDVAGIELSEAGLGWSRSTARCARAGPKVCAIGDLVPGPALAHKASDEGVIAIEDAAGEKTQPINYGDIPRATFCTPTLGAFGLTEEQAREAGHDAVVGKLHMSKAGGLAGDVGDAAADGSRSLRW